MIGIYVGQSFFVMGDEPWHSHAPLKKGLFTCFIEMPFINLNAHAGPPRPLRLTNKALTSQTGNTSPSS
jgi:hypothetical protein